MSAGGDSSSSLAGAERTTRVKAHARAAGFDLVGVTGTSVPEGYARYLAAMAAGYGADMEWLWENTETREDVRRLWPQARSVIALAVSYASRTPGYLAQPPGPDEGWIARYAQGRDYHLVVKKMLVDLARRLAADAGLGAIPSQEHRVFVDTGPVLEKAFAQAAGLGWIGKNSLLIHPGTPGSGRGSWYFLATVLTPLELAPDAPGVDRCGSCTRCLDVCPTEAFVSPYVLDARKCISTWTIESEEPAAVIDAARIGQHVFGCDLCQEVCPWNRRVEPTRHGALMPRVQNVRVALDELAALDEEGFRQRFPKSAVRRVSAQQMRQSIAAIRLGQAAGQVRR